MPYPVNPAPPELELPRPVFPPNAVAAGQTPSVHGPDLIAYKRALSRAGRWPWNPAGWDDAFSNAFAHGTTLKGVSAIGSSGVAGLQAQAGLEPTGWLDEGTFEVLRISLDTEREAVRPRGRTALRLGLHHAARSRGEAVRGAAAGRGPDPRGDCRVPREGGGERAGAGATRRTAR